MKVLITIKNIIDAETIENLRNDGIDIVEESNDIFNSNRLRENFNDTNIVIGGEELKSLIVKQFPQLQLIQTISAGYDYLETEEIFKNNIQLSNASGIYSIPIAEWVLGQVLFAFKKFQSFKEAQEKRLWKPDYNLRELNGKKVLVFGTGSIGVEVCKRFVAFNCEVDGVNSNGRPIQGFNNCFSLSTSPSIINEYDILVFALPSNSKTKNFLDASVLKEISDNCILLNVGRGDLINEDDLLELIKEKSEILVFLDVLNEEPLPKDNALWKHPQVFVTPHTSFSSTNNNERLKHLIISNMFNVKNNMPIVNEIKWGGIT